MLPKLQWADISPEANEKVNSVNRLSHSEGDKKMQTPPKQGTWHKAHPGQTVAPPGPAFLRAGLDSSWSCSGRDSLDLLTPDRGRARQGKCGDAHAVNFLIYFNPHWHQPRPSQVSHTIPDTLTIS